MKFNGKEYYEYVHDRLNKSLVDKFEDPLDEYGIAVLAHRIITEIAEERVLTQDDGVSQRKDIADCLTLGAWVGTIGYINATGVVSKVHLPVDVWLQVHTYLEKAPVFAAAIVGVGVTISSYYSMRRANRQANDTKMTRCRDLVSQIRNGKVLFSPQKIAALGEEDQIYYELGLQSALPDEVKKMYDEADKQMKRVHRIGNIMMGLTAVGMGYIFDQTAVGIGAGIMYVALDYAINNINFIKQPYYKRKIDKEIQKIVDEYQYPQPPKVA